MTIILTHAQRLLDDSHRMDSAAMEDIANTALNFITRIFAYFYEEWGWSGVAFLLFWLGVGVVFVVAHIFYSVAEMRSKR